MAQNTFVDMATAGQLQPSDPQFQLIAARRKNEIYNMIPKAYIIPSECFNNRNLVDLPITCGILSKRELTITSRTATKLLQRLHSREYTAVEVTQAFCKRAAIAHQATNCLAWIMFSSALAAAAELDEYMRINGKPKGPLHGLPISVKEHIDFAGTPATSGFVAWADNVATEDALIVKVLREAGAVFHVKTTNPQALMALETSSFLYGTTTNPHNTNLSPGGSSGGEAALIAMRGSLIGIGTDIGGSIRAPCGFSGIYGLKPSVGRLPHGGLAGPHGGMENIVGCVGPMATCLEDLDLFCQVVLAAEPWKTEVSLFPMSWNLQSSKIAGKPLKIGIMMHDGIVHPHPPVTRTMQNVSQALHMAGHQVVSFSSSLHQDIIDTINAMYYLDSGSEYHEILSLGNEPAIPLLTTQLTAASKKTYSVRDTWALNRRRTRLQEAHAKQWNAAGLDCLICPVGPSVAPAHGETTYWGYTSVWNSLDLSAAVIPVSTVAEGDTWENYPRSEHQSWGADDRAYEGYYGAGEDAWRKYEGAPVAIQIVGRRLAEENLLGMVGRVENAWTDFVTRGKENRGPAGIPRL